MSGVTGRRDDEMRSSEHWQETQLAFHHSHILIGRSTEGDTPHTHVTYALVGRRIRNPFGSLNGRFRLNKDVKTLRAVRGFLMRLGSGLM